MIGRLLKKFNSKKPSYVKEMAYKEIDELNEHVNAKFINQDVK